MKSKISFCNLTVVKKDITRFWPLWLVQFILLQLVSNIAMYFSLANTFRDEMLSSREKMVEAQDTMAGMLIGGSNVFVTAVVAITAAVLVFGYLYRKVSAYAIHSLPLSRITLFCSHYAAGFLMITVPYLLTFLVTGAINVIFGLGMGAAVFGAFLKVLVMLVFFYSLACLVVMFSGTSEMSVLIYGVLNVLAGGFSALLGAVMENTCYGMKELMLSDIMGGLVEYLTPVYHFLKTSKVSNFYIFSTSGSGAEIENMGAMLMKAPWHGLGQCVWYLVPAVLFCVAAWFLYQRRPLENTGDVMAFSWCKAVFRTVFSICGSMLFTIIFWIVSREFLGRIVTYQAVYFMAIVLLVIFSVISYLISEMLLAKSFMIWKKISFRQMGIVCVVMPLLFVICHAIYQKNRVLDVQDITRLQLQFCGAAYQYNDNEVPEGLEELQKEILDGGSNETVYTDFGEWEDYVHFDLEYITKDGKTESHSYKVTLERQPELSAKIQDFFNRQEDKINRLFPETYDAEHMSDVLLEKGYETIEEGREWPAEEMSMIFTAVLKDLEEGNMVVANIDAYKDGDNRRSISLWFKPKLHDEQWDYSFYMQQRFFITDKCTHTLDALQKLKVEF